LDSYRHIKIFPENVQQQTCAALQPLKAISKFEKEEHAGIVGLDGFPKGSCKRRISPNSRGTGGLIAFTPPPTETSSPSKSPVRENLQGLLPSNCLSPIPRKRLHPTLDSPSTQSEVLSDPAAGMASPRFSWAADMVPDRKEVAGQRGMSPKNGVSPKGAPPCDVVSPRSLIRSAATLGTGLYAEEPAAMLENFLGARKGRPTSPRGASPAAVSPSETLGFGSLSWGEISEGGAPNRGAAGGYGLEVAARQAAGHFHGSGTLGQALRSKGDEVTFKEPFMRHRQKVLEHRAQSPRRWR